MKFEEVLEKRRSIRKYKDTPVPKEKILKILEAARIAPSASHRQPWHFIVVENKETIKKLAKQPWAEAPVMIVGLADQAASPNWCSNDLGIAFEHLVLAATNLAEYLRFSFTSCLSTPTDSSPTTPNLEPYV